MYKKYLKRSVIIFTILMFVIGSINFIIDPRGIYFKKTLADDTKSAEFAHKLFNSKYGIVADDWNERLIKTTLAKKSGNFDCIVLGSSRVMQISNIRNTGNIKNQCDSLLNLGVSGGSIEDIAIFSYIILSNIELPKKVFIAIDPWTLKFGMDDRYGIYQEYYKKMNILLGLKESDDTFYIIALAKNLFDLEYLTKSVRTLVKNTHINFFEKDIVYLKNQFSYQEGYKNRVMLPDGSNVFSKQQILEFKSKNPHIKNLGNYKIGGRVYDNLTLQYLVKIIQLYKENGVKVGFILSPYHPNVFKNGNTKPVKHFKIIESMIKKFGQKNNLKVYGSFSPYSLGCKDKEFFDFMHPTNECLSRINFSQ